MKKRQVENENKSRKARICLIVQTLAPRHAKRLRKTSVKAYLHVANRFTLLAVAQKGP
ncbi:hypothetical protein [Cronobacter malonaticus]|uniref:hypothetical protein n=1 Tax=Cronobacter malonaticus TaxID=413503 RepID=UPI001315794F|nr:hypothetical protein [Cronobacter malonaticus]